MIVIWYCLNLMYSFLLGRNVIRFEEELHLLFLMFYKAIETKCWAFKPLSISALIVEMGGFWLNIDCVQNQKILSKLNYLLFRFNAVNKPSTLNNSSSWLQWRCIQPLLANN